MTTNKLMLAALLACVFAPALADEMSGEAQQRVERRIISHNGHEIHMAAGAAIDDAMVFPGMQMHRHKLVKNAPYSAEVVSERMQNLADGNQIASKTSGMSYRDSAGRTRHEMRGADGELRTVTIRDAVEGSTYILNPRTKTATKLGAVDPEMARAAGERARARIEQLRKEGKLPTVERGSDGERVIVKRIERVEGDVRARVESDVHARVQEEVRVRIASRMAGAPETMIHVGPMLAGAFGNMKYAANATTKDLGTRDMDGVKATGKLRSYEIPAGAVGNRNAIVVSDETWYSPDLQVTVYTKHSDPRSGDIIYRMDNLKRDEPAAALFAVPADYKVKDVMAHVKKRIEQKAQ